MTGLPHESLEHDGWSGSELVRIRSGARSYVLKRTSLARDWIARELDDRTLREVRFAATVASPDPLASNEPVVAPYYGASIDGDEGAVLMPDLAGTLLPWTEPMDMATLDTIVDALAAFHAGGPIADAVRAAPPSPLDRRLLLLSEPSSHRYIADGMWNGSVYLPGWVAYRRLAPPDAVALVDDLSADPQPLIEALGRLPQAALHGDLKLANVGPIDSGRVVAVDWQMLLVAPLALELGWLVVSNIQILPEPPMDTLERYRRAAERHDVPSGDWDAQRDLAVLCGLLLRGWRKGLDAEAGVRYPSGLAAFDDLTQWSELALEAAARRL